MIDRRMFLHAAAGGALVTPFAGVTPARAQSGGPALRFGIIADPQYAPVPPRGTRFYANSLWKLNEAISEFNRRDLAFAATLGDIIDRHWDSYSHILPIYDTLAPPHYSILGNHDYDVAGDYLSSVERVTGMQRAHYDYAAGDHRFIVLDGNDISTFANPPGSDAHELATERLARMEAAGAINAKRWNGGLSEAQFAWIEEVLKDGQNRGQRVLVQGHYPIYPKDQHNLWDDERLVELLTSYDNFIMYMNGHNHAGNYGRIGNRHFVNFKGMVETATTTAYATVELHDDRIEIIGHGVEDSRTLAL